MRVGDAARYVGLPEVTFIKWVGQGHMPPGADKGNTTYWLRDDLDEAVALMDDDPKVHDTRPAFRATGIVYLVRAEKTGLVKVGFTDQPVETRLAGLQTGFLRADEVDIHRALAKWRKHGEWFDLGSRVEDFIAAARAAGLLDAAGKL